MHVSEDLKARLAKVTPYLKERFHITNLSKEEVLNYVASKGLDELEEWARRTEGTKCKS